MPSIPTLDSPRLRLRAFTEADVGALRDVIFSDPDVMKTMVGAGDTPEGERQLAAEWIDRWARCWSDHGHGVWAVEIRDPSLGPPGALIGLSGFEAPTVPGWGPEVIAGRGKPWWSRGISKELFALVMGWIFGEWGAPAIHCLIFMTLNPASVRAAERGGLTLRGTVPIWERVGPRYQAAMVRLEARRIRQAPPETSLDELDRAAFKTGQLLSCPPLDPQPLLARLRHALPDHRPAIDRAFAAAAAWDAALFQSLGTSYCVRTAERATTAPPTGEIALAELFEDLAAMSATIAVEQVRARDALVHAAHRRWSTDPAVLAVVERRVAEQFTAGLAEPHMGLYALEREVFR